MGRNRQSTQVWSKGSVSSSDALSFAGSNPVSVKVFWTVHSKEQYPSLNKSEARRLYITNALGNWSGGSTC